MTPLERYADFMQTVASFNLDTLDEFIAEDVHFVDPFNDTFGLPHYRRIIEDMREQLEELDIDVLDSAMVAEDRALLRWRLSGKLTAFKGRPWSVEGCSMVRFNDEYHGTSSKPSNFLRTQLYLRHWFEKHAPESEEDAEADTEETTDRP